MRLDFKVPAQAEQYHNARKGSFKLRKKYEAVERIARKRRCRCLVDVGCGTAPLLELASEREWFTRLIGCEPVEHLLDLARANVPSATLSAETWDTLEIPAERALICFNDVYHHIEDKRAALHKLRSVLRTNSGSVAVVFEPNCYNPITFIHQLNDDGIRLSFSHVHKPLMRSCSLQAHVSYLCAGRDAEEQPFWWRMLEGTPFSGVCCYELEVAD